MVFLFLYLFLINAVGLFLMLSDKHRAQNNLWRISERTLLAVAVLYGSFGVLLGMKLGHHKTKKPKFSIGVPFLFVIQVIFAIFLFFL